MATFKQYRASLSKAEADFNVRLTRLMRGTLVALMNEAQEPQPSVKLTGGTFEIGKVPLDTERLWSSLVTTVNGSPSAPGVKSYLWKINRMQIGDFVEFSWTTPYAKRIEFGFSGQDSLGRRYNQKGRLFATTAYQRFYTIYNEQAARVR